MPAPLSVTVDLADDKIKFVGAARGFSPVPLDYPPPLGTDQGYMPLELLLMSLAACAGGTVASLLRRMHKDVTALQVTAQGVRREAHPTCFERITLTFGLRSQDATETDVQRALQLSEETYCPVWAMLKGNVAIACQTRLIAE